MELTFTKEQFSQYQNLQESVSKLEESIELYPTDEGKKYLTLLESKLGEFTIPTIKKSDFEGGVVEYDFDNFDGKGWTESSEGEFDVDRLFEDDIDEVSIMEIYEYITYDDNQELEFLNGIHSEDLVVLGWEITIKSKV